MTDDDFTWEYSCVEYDAKPVSIEGFRTFIIEDASFEPDAKEYDLTLKDVETGYTHMYRYWMTYTDSDTGASMRNSRTLGTLDSLNFALTGVKSEYGKACVPRPDTVVGLVVSANNVIKDSKYPRIYKFLPAPKDMVDAYSMNPDQYSVEYPEE